MRSLWQKADPGSATPCEPSPPPPRFPSPDCSHRRPRRYSCDPDDLRPGRRPAFLDPTATPTSDRGRSPVWHSAYPPTPAWPAIAACWPARRLRRSGSRLAQASFQSRSRSPLRRAAEIDQAPARKEVRTPAAVGIRRVDQNRLHQLGARISDSAADQRLSYQRPASRRDRRRHRSTAGIGEIMVFLPCQRSCADVRKRTPAAESRQVEIVDRQLNARGQRICRLGGDQCEPHLPPLELAKNARISSSNSETVGPSCLERPS